MVELKVDDGFWLDVEKGAVVVGNVGGGVVVGNIGGDTVVQLLHSIELNKKP